MQQKQTFSAQTLTLSVAAAELGRAIFGQRLPSEPPGLCRKVHLCRLSALVSF